MLTLNFKIVQIFRDIFCHGQVGTTACWRLSEFRKFVYISRILRNFSKISDVRFSWWTMEPPTMARKHDRPVDDGAPEDVGPSTRAKRARKSSGGGMASLSMAQSKATPLLVAGCQNDIRLPNVTWHNCWDVAQTLSSRRFVDVQTLGCPQRSRTKCPRAVHTEH